MTDPDSTNEYGLVMPFVVVQSAGGPYDDKSFGAGWTCATVDERLRGLAENRHGYLASAEVRQWVQPEEVPQLDLIAMKHGFTLTTEEHGEHLMAVFAKENQ